MSTLRLVLTLLLTLTLSVSGFAVHAQPAWAAAMDMQMMSADHGDKVPCPMAGKHSENQPDCCKDAGAGKHTQNKQDKSGCCQNAACAAQCSSVGSMTSTPFAEAWRSTSGEKYSTADIVLSSFAPQTQDRPPKHLL